MLELLRKKKTEIEEIENRKLPVLVRVKDLNEEPSIVKGMQTLKIIDYSSVPQLEDVVIKEEVKSNGKATRTDYLLIPRVGIIKLDELRFGIYPRKARRFDTLIYMCMIDQWPAFFNERPQNILTNDGSEIYMYKNTPLIELESDVCTFCSRCNEITSAYWSFEDAKDFNNHFSYLGEAFGDICGRRRIRDIRTYKIKPILRALLEKSKILITSIEHPCQYQSLDYLLSQQYTLDPHNLKIVFPEDFKLK